ncbi:MAG: glycoside hydrolase domain-containing protein, partial [bacterium]
NTRSETVRLGFHVESAQEQIYSSYNSPETPNGIVQLRPGETRKLRLRHSNPKMTLDGNVLWFDVRSSGTPSKTLFCTRLIKFHLMDGGRAGSPPKNFRERRLDVIKSLRPERIPFFDFRVDVSPYTKRLMAVLDRGIVGVKEEVKTAIEAQLIVRNIVDGEENDVHEFKAPVIGNFAMFDVIASNLVPGEVYSVTALMFDENMKIVGEQTEKEPFIKLNQGAVAATTGTRSDKFTLLPELEQTTALKPRLMFTQDERPAATRKFDTFQVASWMNNKIGLADEVWEPFTPIRVTEKGFETLKHRFTIDESGLPAQIEILPDPRELPLELRAGGKAPDDVLQMIGRGAQFRAPMRLEAVVSGKRVAAKVTTPAKAIRTWKSEIEYASALEIGSLPAELKIRYDCDGSFRASLRYGGDTPVKIDRLELVTDIAGIVDLAVSETLSFTDTGSDRGECGLPNKPGVVWDSTETKMELFYSRFIPSLWFGSADRGWSYYCNSDRGWILDRDGSSMLLERNKSGEVTWRVAFVNHPAEVTGRRTIDFAILTHPAKPKPENFRQQAWHYTVGRMWALMEIHASANWTDDSELLSYMIDDARLRSWWRNAAGAGTQIPEDQRTVWRNDMPPYLRYGYGGGAHAMNLPDMNRLFEDKGAFYLGRLISFGRRTGWWMNDYKPIEQSQNLAMDDAYLRPPNQISSNEVPWQAGFMMFHMRDLYKRLARVQAAENV